MSKKLYLPVILLIMLSMILGACAPAPAAPEVTEAPIVVATEAPTAVPPTPVPPTEVPPTPTPEPPDAEALFSALFDSMPADKGFGSVTAAKLNEELVDKPPFLLDVREAAEVEADGYIQGSVNIPIRELLKNLDKLPGLDDPIVVYCASGHRGGIGLAALRLMGYTNVRNLGGGLGAWKKGNLEVVTGSMPEAPQAISTAIIADQPLYAMLDGFLSSMPDNFYTVKTDMLAEELTGTPPTVIDVRTTGEWDSQGYIEGAVNIPFSEFFTRLGELPAKDAPVVVLCASGHRGSMVMMAMQLMGYENVRNLGGGLTAWKAAKLPVAGWVDWPGVWGEYLAGMPDNYHVINAQGLNEALVDSPPFLVDVRESADYEAGYIAGAINLPIRDLLKNLDKLPGKDEAIVIYCASGHRGGLAMAALQLLGYTNVRNLGGGLGAWQKAELPVETAAAPELTAGTAPEVDATRLRDLDAFLSALPDGFFTVKPVDVNVELGASPAPYILDVRSAEEFAGGYIEAAVNIALRDLPANLATLPADKAAPIVILCASGHRGAIGMMYLRMLGYTEVRNLGGGMNAWIAAELPVVK